MWTRESYIGVLRAIGLVVIDRAQSVRRDIIIKRLRKIRSKLPMLDTPSKSTKPQTDESNSDSHTESEDDSSSDESKI